MICYTVNYKDHYIELHQITYKLPGKLQGPLHLLLHSSLHESLHRVTCQITYTLQLCPVITCLLHGLLRPLLHFCLHESLHVITCQITYTLQLCLFITFHISMTVTANQPQPPPGCFHGGPAAANRRTAQANRRPRSGGRPADGLRGGKPADGLDRRRTGSRWAGARRLGTLTIRTNCGPAWPWLPAVPFLCGWILGSQPVDQPVKKTQHHHKSRAAS